MDPEPDELAGVADRFGGLTHGELRGALRDLAARAGEPFDERSVESAIEAALEEYYLVEVDGPPAEPLLVAGPTALPVLPEGGEDLPHLVDVEPRSIDPDDRGVAALEALRADAVRAVTAADVERIEDLRSICYDVEAWAPVETDELRERLADAATDP